MNSHTSDTVHLCNWGPWSPLSDATLADDESVLLLDTNGLTVWHAVGISLDMASGWTLFLTGDECGCVFISSSEIFSNFGLTGSPMSIGVGCSISGLVLAVLAQIAEQNGFFFSFDLESSLPQFSHGTRSALLAGESLLRAIRFPGDEYKVELFKNAVDWKLILIFGARTYVEVDRPDHRHIAGGWLGMVPCSLG